jgi:hypothetical protein
LFSKLPAIIRSLRPRIPAGFIARQFHSAIDIGLEASFAAMGFHLEEGGNYSRVYPASTVEDLDKIAEDMEIIFRDLYHADSSAPFEVNDVE